MKSPSAQVKTKGRRTVELARGDEGGAAVGEDALDAVRPERAGVGVVRRARRDRHRGLGAAQAAGLDDDTAPRRRHTIDETAKATEAVRVRAGGLAAVPRRARNSKRNHVNYSTHFIRLLYPRPAAYSYSYVTPARPCSVSSPAAPSIFS